MEGCTPFAGYLKIGANHAGNGHQDAGDRANVSPVWHLLLLVAIDCENILSAYQILSKRGVLSVL